MVAAVLASRSVLPSGFETSELVLNLSSQIAIGVIAFIGAQLLLWNLMRRPEGPETELIALFKRLLVGRGARLLGRWA